MWYFGVPWSQLPRWHFALVPSGAVDHFCLAPTKRQQVTYVNVGPVGWSFCLSPPDPWLEARIFPTVSEVW